MIHSIRIQDFKGHRDTTVKLGRLTVLVGPNGSGKTSVLDAIELERELLFNATKNVFEGDKSLDHLQRRGSNGPMIFSSSGSLTSTTWNSTISVSSAGRSSVTIRLGGKVTTQDFGINSYASDHPDFTSLVNLLGTSKAYKFHAANIAAAAYSDHPGANIRYNGKNTAVALAELKLGYDEIFARIEEEMRTIVPSIERVRIRQATVVRDLGDVVGSKIYFDFRGAAGVPAHCASEGTLITLALLTVLHGPNRPNLILLDDFDQSLHPQAQMELVTLIKRLLDEFTDLQIVATTHSPYILDQLEPSDVHVFALREDGTVATRPLSEHPEATRMKGALTTGQIWTLDQERTWVLEGQTP